MTAGTLLAAACAGNDADESPAAEVKTSDIVRGTAENSRNYVMNLRFTYSGFDTATGNPLIGSCTGTLTRSTRS